MRLWKTFTDCFNALPAAALIDEKILCMHGGLSPDLKSLDQIKKIHRPCDVPDQGLLCDLLWSDPNKETKGTCTRRVVDHVVIDELSTAVCASPCQPVCVCV